MTPESEETGIQLLIKAIAVAGITLDAQTAKMVEKGSLPNGELLRERAVRDALVRVQRNDQTAQCYHPSRAARLGTPVLPVGRGKLTALLLPSLSTARTPKK